MDAESMLRRERDDLCDTFERVGPDAPTLCEGWTAADLAAHLVVREHRPDALPGIAPIPRNPFAAHTQRLMEAEKAKGFDSMLVTLRAGPPFLFRFGPAAALNVVENWIHHEDVRRATGEGPRPADLDLDALLWRGLGFSARIGALRLRVGLRIEAEGFGTRCLRSGTKEAVVRGAPGELTLYFAGRKDAARVELDGDTDAIAAVRATRFGI